MFRPGRRPDQLLGAGSSSPQQMQGHADRRRLREELLDRGGSVSPLLFLNCRFNSFSSARISQSI